MNDILHKLVPPTDAAKLRKFRRQAKRLLHRLATNGLGLHRSEFTIRVHEGTTREANLVSLHTENWYVAVTPPLVRGGADISYAPWDKQNSRPIGPVQHTDIDSLLDVQKFARLLRPPPHSSPELAQYASVPRSRMRR